MPIFAKQLNFCDISTDFDEFYNQNQNDLLSLLSEFIDISDFIPFSFYQKYYSHFGRKRDFSLEAMLNAFIIKNILSIPSIDLLITFLSISSELRKFCGFLKVPHKSQFSRFKLNFLDNLNDLLNALVDHTEDISEEINPFLSSILITDTTGFEAYVTENNPKFYQSELRKSKNYSKVFKKNNPDSVFDIEKYAQGQMPKNAFSNPDAKLTYLNGHFGYFIKCIISTNALGLVRDVNFFNSDNVIEKDLRPEDIKDSFDAKSLIPALETHFQLHPKSKKTTINGKTQYILSCENPCTPSKCGWIKNLTIHHNYRFNTSMPRDSLKWQKLYRLRTICERAISQIKNFIQIKTSKVRNTVSLKSDILLACISQLIAFILIFKSGNSKNPLAIKTLIA